MRLRKALAVDLEAIVGIIDGEFTKEGYGFVNKAQIDTEIHRGSVTVAENDGAIVGVRIGVDTVWNLVVTKSERGKGVGRALINHRRPSTIRVKSDPIGHLSKEQRSNFTDPTAFYEALGYKFWGNSYPRNFWQKGKGGKGQYHKLGNNPHIRVFKDGERLLLRDEGDI